MYLSSDSTRSTTTLHQALKTSTRPITRSEFLPSLKQDKWNTILTQSPYVAETLVEDNNLTHLLRYISALDQKKFLRIKVCVCLTFYAMMRDADVYDIV